MSCCASGAEVAAPEGLPSEDELRAFSRKLGDGTSQIGFSVPAIHCGTCIKTIESTLSKLGEVTNARVNLTTKRVSVAWNGETVPPIVPTMCQIGYPPFLYEDAGQSDGKLKELVRAVAVAGFAAGNIMLLSVSVWSG